MQTETTKFRDYIITEIHQESVNIKSFYLQPASGDLPSYVPGEYMVFDIPTAPNAEKIRREYSISNWHKDTLRVTIKLEEAPVNQSDLPDGIASTYFHKKLKAGDTISAFGPSGKFLLKTQTKRPVVLLSGGVGQTPLVAMAHALTEIGERETLFIHACENGDQHAMAREITELKNKSSNLKTHVCYKSPLAIDRLGIDYDSQGFVTAEILKTEQPIENFDFYLCGPGPFMEAMYKLLLSLGVEESSINYEFFGPATVLKSGVEKSNAVKTMSQGNSDQPIVTFSKSGIKVPWDPEIDNLLEFAEEHGLMPDFSCRAGTCDSCKTKLENGEISYTTTPMELPSEDNVLICCSIPKGNVTLDL